MALPKITTPTYQIKLSGDTFHYRPFIVREEKLLLIAFESEDQKQMVDALIDVLGNCITEDVNIRQMPIFDVMFLFANLRMKSKGEILDVGLKCSECEHSNKVSVNLEDTKIVGDIQSNKKIEFSDNIGIHMKYPTIEIWGTDIEMNTVKGQFDILRECITRIYDDKTTYDCKDYSAKDIEEWVDTLPEKCFEKIMKFLNDIPKMQLDVNFKCEKCNHDNETKITDIQSFFG